jgi:hypothetical protein
MDTDDLSEMAYETLLIAESTNRDLMLVLAVLSEDYSSENEYMQGVLQLMRHARSNPEEFFEEWLFDDSLSLKALVKGAGQIETHVQMTLATPLERRGPTV